MIELLVVLAVIAALAAILLPVFARVREAGRRAACKAQMHQIGLGIQLYRDDWGGIDPVKGRPLSHAEMGLPYSPNPIFRQYVRNRSVWFCPSAPIDRPDLGSTYAAVFISSEVTDPSRDWEALAAARGPDYPILLCEGHNGPSLPSAARDANEVMYYHVLRIDQRLDVRLLPFRITPTIDVM